MLTSLVFLFRYGKYDDKYGKYDDKYGKYDDK